jgi:5-methylcytosine-specific restriction endonuclease McrBC GTP-binding regulatory subunit McrB
MRIYLIKVKDKSVVEQILNKQEFIHSGIYNFGKDINIDDLVFIYLGGDKALISWEQGIRALGRITAVPYDLGYDKSKPRNFKIKIKPFDVLLHSISPKKTKIHPKYSEAVYDIPYVGANHFPNQAIASYETSEGVYALLKIYQKNGQQDFAGFENILKEVTPTMSKENTPETSVYSYLRTFTSLQSKPFLLLTGLSGSGKTKLALSFAKWISRKNSWTSDLAILKSALKSESIVGQYELISLDGKMLELVNKRGGSGKIIPLPVDTVLEWYRALKDGIIDSTGDPKELRHIVGESSIYQKYIHGFYGELMKLGVAMTKVIIPNNDVTLESQYEMIAVGADWTSNENLLGYPDALKPGVYRKPDNGALDLILRAKSDPEYPYFLILDEMNLSHVERYFADFLSAMESGEPINLHDGGENALWPSVAGGEHDVPGKLTVPNNLFVIGTVNVDETTYMFSPKVLDRANVIEFRVADEDMETFLANPVKPDLDAIAGQGAKFAKDFVREAKQKDVALDEVTRNEVSSVLMQFFPALQDVGAEFGYRSAHEICRFIYFYKKLAEDFNFDTAMDAAIMQKLLPKLHGSKKKLSPVLETLIKLCTSDITPAEGEENNIKYPVSMEKLIRMQERLQTHGFTSFAEA